MCSGSTGLCHDLPGFHQQLNRSQNRKFAKMPPVVGTYILHMMGQGRDAVITLGHLGQHKNWESQAT